MSNIWNQLNGKTVQNHQEIRRAPEKMKIFGFSSRYQQKNFDNNDSIGRVLNFNASTFFEFLEFCRQYFLQTISSFEICIEEKTQHTVNI